LQWQCRGKDLAAVVPSSTVTAAAAVWGGNCMQKGKNKIGKSIP
jgi:hypothetical protein